MTAHTAEPETLTVPEAARRFGISVGQGYELARRGELPGLIKLGGRYVVSKAVVDRILAGSDEATGP